MIANQFGNLDPRLRRLKALNRLQITRRGESPYDTMRRAGWQGQPGTEGQLARQYMTVPQQTDYMGQKALQGKSRADILVEQGRPGRVAGESAANIYETRARGRSGLLTGEAAKTTSEAGVLSAEEAVTQGAHQRGLELSREPLRTRGEEMKLQQPMATSYGAQAADVAAAAQAASEAGDMESAQQLWNESLRLRSEERNTLQPPMGPQSSMPPMQDEQRGAFAPPMTQFPMGQRPRLNALAAQSQRTRQEADIIGADSGLTDMSAMLDSIAEKGTQPESDQGLYTLRLLHSRLQSFVQTGASPDAIARIVRTIESHPAYINILRWSETNVGFRPPWRRDEWRESLELARSIVQLVDSNALGTGNLLPQ